MDQFVNIKIDNSKYIIENVLSIPKRIQYDLSKWNVGYFRRDPIGYYYDKDKKELRIPRGYMLNSITSEFPYYNKIDISKEFKRGDTDIGLLNFPRDYIQENVLAYMTGNSGYEYTLKENQLYVDLTTGYGKTYLLIATACYFRTKCLVLIPPISKIANQWIDTLDKFTTLNTNEYLYVQGSNMCKDIIQGKYKNIKFFIMPRSTILSFVRKYDNNWSLVEKLVDAMDVSIKAIDEAHMDFNTIVNIDCFTNVPKTYYLSSSPSRSDKEEKDIYYKIFKNVPKFGKTLITKEQNYLIPLIIKFRSKTPPAWEKKIKTRYGPSLAKYGEYLLAEDGAKEEFVDAFLFTLFWMQQLRRDGGKILVICITVEFAKTLLDITKSIFPYLTYGLFVGSDKNKNKELDNDVIFSTTKSMGTGSEIQNHQLTINTITYSSDVMADQISGRIRKQSNRKGIYCEIVNIENRVAVNHYRKREQFLIAKAKNGKILTHEVTQSDLNILMSFLNKKYKYDYNGIMHDKNNKIIIKKGKR